MNVPREQVFEALLSVLGSAVYNGQPAFKTVSRNFKHWTDTPAALQPALFLRQIPGGTASQDFAFKMTKWKLRAAAWIYCKYSPNSAVTPGVTLNYLVDAVDQILIGSPAFPTQTLGGLVIEAYIDGTIMIDEGYLPKDDQSIAVLPVTIVAGM